jgi:hypothetical protein
MTSLKNPFEIFGVTPEMAHHLEEKDLFQVVKALYRCLHKLYHPDRTVHRGAKASPKDADRATELNLAFELLDLDKNHDSFRHYQKLYAARRGRGLRKKVSDLTNDLRRSETNMDALAQNFMEYMIHNLAWCGHREAESGPNGPVPLLPEPTAVRLGLNDVAINCNVKACAWDLGSNYKEIVFDHEGGMYYRPVGRSRAYRVNYIRLLGTVPVERLDLKPLLNQAPPRENFFRGPALDSRYSIYKPQVEVLNTLSLDKFKTHCLPFLRPELRERAYLFSIQRPVYEQESNISLEGVIVKISDL